MSIRFADQEFIPAGTSVVDLNEALSNRPGWDAVVNLGIVPVDPPPQSGTIQHKGLSEWFQWQIGILTGGPITKDTSPFEIRAKICMIEALMQKSENDGKLTNAVEGYPLKHSFSEGIYVREISIPAGHVVVGKIHKHEHPNFISKGRVTVVTEQGGVEELVAPVTIISPAGTKRLLFTHEDTVWTTIHATDYRDVDTIVDHLTAKTYTELGLEQPNVPLMLENLK